MTAVFNRYTRGDSDRDPQILFENTDGATNTNLFPAPRPLGTYRVPAGTKAQIKTLCLNAGQPTNVLGIANGGNRNIGRIFLKINGTTQFEVRVQGSSIWIFGMASEDGSALWMHWCQQWNYGDGIVIPAGEAITITATPAESAPTLWNGAIVGIEGGVLTAKRIKKTTRTTTADQTIFTYTPTTDFTFLTWRCEAIVLGNTIGWGNILVNGQMVANFGRIGMDDTCSNFGDTNVTTFGSGGIFIPLWGMNFYPGETIAHGFYGVGNDDGEVCSCIFADEVSLSAGAVYPIADDVRNNVNYGPNGNDYNGDLVLPAVGDVRSGTGYGADGTEFTGTLSVGGGGNTYSRGRVVNK